MEKNAEDAEDAENAENEDPPPPTWTPDEEIARNELLAARNKLLLDARKGVGFKVHDSSSLDVFLKDKMSKNDFMIECWNEIIGLGNIKDNFDNFIFFLIVIWPVIWPNIDPRKGKKLEFSEEPEGPPIDYAALKENFKQQFAEIPFDTRKQNFINDIKKNLPVPRKYTTIEFDYSKDSDEKLNNLYTACIQYLKNKDGSGYNKEGKLTADNLQDFFNDDMSQFMYYYEPETFGIGESVAIKLRLFTDEIFQQNYVEEYIRVLLINNDLPDIEKSKFPTDINSIMPGLIDVQKGGDGDILGKEVDMPIASTQDVLNKENEKRKNEYMLALKHIKLQLRLLFDSFRNTVVSPIIDTLFQERASIIKQISDDIANEKNKEMKNAVNARNEKRRKENETKQSKKQEHEGILNDLKEAYKAIRVAIDSNKAIDTNMLAPIRNNAKNIMDPNILKRNDLIIQLNEISERQKNNYQPFAYSDRIKELEKQLKPISFEIGNLTFKKEEKEKAIEMHKNRLGKTVDENEKTVERKVIERATTDLNNLLMPKLRKLEEYEQELIGNLSDEKEAEVNTLKINDKENQVKYKQKIIEEINKDLASIDTLYPQDEQLTEDEKYQNVESIELTAEQIANSEPLRDKLKNTINFQIDETKKDTIVDRVIKNNRIEIFFTLFPEALKSNEEYKEKYNKAKTEYKTSIGDQRTTSDAFKLASKSIQNSRTVRDRNEMLKKEKAALEEAKRKREEEKAEAKRMMEEQAKEEKRKREEEMAEAKKKRAEDTAEAKRIREAKAAEEKREREAEAEMRKKEQEKQKRLDQAKKEEDANLRKNEEYIRQQESVNNRLRPQGVPGPPPRGSQGGPPPGPPPPRPAGPPTGTPQPGGKRNTKRSFIKSNKNTRKHNIMHKSNSKRRREYRHTFSKMDSKRKHNRRSRKSK